MTERCIFDFFELRGAEFEIWVDGGPETWWIVAQTNRDAEHCRVPAHTVLTGDEFDPPLTPSEIQHIRDAVFDWYANVD